MGNRQEKLETIVQQENYGVVTITEIWWDDSHNMCYKLFRKDRPKRRGSGVALYVIGSVFIVLSVMMVVIELNVSG